VSEARVIKYSEIAVLIAHPAGDIEVLLDEWIKNGPGPRVFLRPISAKNKISGQTLPLDVVPLEYRNDEESLALIIDGKLIDPWNRGLELLNRILERIRSEN